MKHFFHSFAVISATLFVFTLTALAAEIHMGFYEYGYGKTATELKDREVFVISENSIAHPRLVLRPKIAPLALRTSKAQAVTNTKTIAEVETENHSSAEQRTVTSTIGQPCYDHICLLPVYFRFDHADLSGFEKDQLDRLVTWVKDNPREAPLKVRITGYTCDLGSRDYNDRLSLLRAKSVASYLENKGFSPLEVRGEGEKHPLSNQVRSLNRRVEINIVH